MLDYYYTGACRLVLVCRYVRSSIYTYLLHLYYIHYRVVDHDNDINAHTHNNQKTLSVGFYTFFLLLVVIIIISSV